MWVIARVTAMRLSRQRCTGRWCGLYTVARGNEEAMKTCTGTGARRCHICTGTGPTPATSAPGTGIGESCARACILHAALCVLCVLTVLMRHRSLARQHATGPCRGRIAPPGCLVVCCTPDACCGSAWLCTPKRHGVHVMKSMLLVACCSLVYPDKYGVNVMKSIGMTYNSRAGILARCRGHDVAPRWPER